MKISERFKNFLTKLQSLPEHIKKIILWTIVAIFGAIMLYFWAKNAIDSFYKIGSEIKIPAINMPNVPLLDISQTTSPSNESSTQENSNQITGWKTYTNNSYNFQVKYPSDWSVRDYGTGVALSPKNKSNEQGAVSVGFYKRGSDYCKIPFEDYVKIAGPSEIQNYESVNTINGGIIESGSQIYQITWNYTDSQGAGKISLPITYFETDPKLCGDVEMFLNDNNYSDIYNEIISTFKFYPVK